MRAIRDNREITTILLLSLIMRLFFYSDHRPLWDASVYLLMGKYIYSFGGVGLWEPLRALVWPVMLGFFWKVGADQIFWGRMLGLLFSLGILYLVYLVGNRVFNKKTGIVAALLLSCSPILFFWGNCVFTGIPSTFFGLLSVYLFVGGRFFASGILAGTAFMTRFAQLITAVLLPVANAAGRDRRVFIRSALKLAAGFLLALSPYLILNQLLYGDMALPFLQMREANSQVPIVWRKEIISCVKLLLRSESFCLLFSVPGIFFCVRKGLKPHSLAIVLIGACTFLWIALFPWAILRLVVPALPYLYLLSSCGVIGLYNWLQRGGRVVRVVFWVALLAFVFFKYTEFRQVRFPLKREDPFQLYVRRNQGAISGDVWISNPSTLVYSDLKAGELIYYPVFDLNRAEELKRGLPSADIILFDSRDFPCVPRDDIQCQMAKSKLVEDIITQFTPEYHVVGPSGGVSGGVFKQKRTQ